VPAIITHDLFAQGVIDDVSTVVPLSTADERDAFLLGSQGPDPLFFLVADPFTRLFAPMGDTMHRSRPDRLLVSMSEGSARLDGSEQRVARAYVAGFVCHYLLDSTVHPFVCSWQHGLLDVGIDGLDATAKEKVHAEIERDLDEALLFARRGETILTYRPFERSLPGRAGVLRVMDKVYFHAALQTYGTAIDPMTFSTAVRAYRGVMGLLYAPHDRRRLAIGSVERIVTHGRYSLCCALSHRNRAEATSDFDNRAHARWTNPFTGEASVASFWDLVDEAAARVVPAVRRVLSPGFDETAAAPLTHGLNFLGEPMASDDHPDQR
jgi:hypothetical protein